MNPAYKQRWIEALRSGKFTKTTGRLCRTSSNNLSGCPVGHCCLGVLCELGVEDGKVKKSRSQAAPSLASFNGNNDGLDDDLMELFGVTFSQRDTLVTMNDQEHASFSEIADWIEKNL